MGWDECGGECDVLPGCGGVCDGLRTAEGKERGKAMIETLLLGAITLALLVYLVYALLRPERF